MAVHTRPSDGINLRVPESNCHRRHPSEWDLEATGGDDRDRPHARADDNLHLTVIELSLGQIDGDGAHVRAYRGQMHDLPATFESNRVHRGRDLERVSALATERRDVDLRGQAAHH